MRALSFLGGIVGFFVLWALSSLWSGYVLTVLWSWFVVPTFHLVQLSLAAAIGIFLVISFMTYHVDLKDDGLEMGERIMKIVSYSIFIPLMTLFFGWVVHFYM